MEKLSKSPADEQPRQKRSHAKVRTGCTTCKARRIKCDEIKPICGRCRMSDRKCVYAVPRTWLFEPHKETLSLKSPASVILGNHEERRAFEFFKQYTATQFAGQHDLAGRFWHKFIPQTATTDMLIFKLAVAMGSQHETVVYGSQQAANLAKESHAVVISTLARNLNNLRVDVSLLCCAMLMAYANLCEEVPATAPVHFSLGLKILREESVPGSKNLSDGMRTMIEPMFGELELATALFSLPTGDLQMICPEPPERPVLPSKLNNLHEAKQCLSDILRWLLYLTVIFRRNSKQLALKVAEVDELLGQWRQRVVKYSLGIAATYPGLFIKARKMLFQYKLFGTCRGAANNPFFVEASRVQILSIDFSRPHITSVLCTLKNNAADSSWRPLATAPARDHDELDIWPQGEPMGHDGTNQIVRITIGS